MKKIIVLVISSCFAITCFSQNIGVGQSNPQMKIHVTSNDSALALLENTQVLNNNVKNSIFFKTGSSYTGGIATVGNGTATARMSLFGFAAPSPSGLKEYVSVLNNGNVGIGIQNPSSLLDVDGNINVSGTITAQGTAGTPGQVLRTDNNGDLFWSTISQYPNFVSFLSSTNWTVPAGVTRILVEAWGGGAGGYTSPGLASYGGGGGGYIIAIASVTPGAVLPIVIGAGGDGGSAATNGGASRVTVGTAYMEATGGFAAPATIGIGGNYLVFNPGGTIVGYDGEEGRDGIQLNFFAVGTNGSVVLYQSQGGHGGDAGHTTKTGGISGTASGIVGNLTQYSTGTAIQRASSPGGGGCVNGTNASATILNRGDSGKVVIHY